MTVTRREFIKHSITAAGCFLVMPGLVACSDSKQKSPLALPSRKPVNWDPIGFNRARGNAGAIPDSYLADINGPDGEKKHIGKHLPYIPELKPGIVPAGYIPIMWGDTQKGHTPHPNAEPGPGNQWEGHWYNWIEIKKSTGGYAESFRSNYGIWPKGRPGDTGTYISLPGTRIAEHRGVNTIYLAKLPYGLKPGDTIRIQAHCLTHGEYVDFVQI